MIFDGIRNAAYTRALKKAITPDTTVMDLGAGLGLHGLIAVRLGAAKAYLVEPTDVIEVARRVAADNNLDEVECIHARVEELELDIKVDVLVSVFRLQIQQLHHQQIRATVVDRSVKEHDPVLQQQVADSHLPLLGVIPRRVLRIVACD
jgi:predicted RNA methylase